MAILFMLLFRYFSFELGLLSIFKDSLGDLLVKYLVLLLSWCFRIRTQLLDVNELGRFKTLSRPLLTITVFVAIRLQYQMIELV